MLRGAGRAILTDNVDACRDLSGRRLRQANAEKRLAEWAAEARERELEKVALKHVKEQQKATQKEERAQVMVTVPEASRSVMCILWHDTMEFYLKQLSVQHLAGVSQLLFAFAAGSLCLHYVNICNSLVKA